MYPTTPILACSPGELATLMPIRKSAMSSIGIGNSIDGWTLFNKSNARSRISSSGIHGATGFAHTLSSSSLTNEILQFIKLLLVERLVAENSTQHRQTLEQCLIVSQVFRQQPRGEGCVIHEIGPSSTSNFESECLCVPIEHVFLLRRCKYAALDLADIPGIEASLLAEST